MRMLVLGAGLQGSACAFDLLQQKDVSRVVLADLNVDALPPFLERYRGDARLQLERVDARDEEAVLRLLDGMAAVMNALPYYFNAQIAALAIRAGVHYSDLGGNTELVFQQLEMDAQARQRGVSVVPDCGLAPGMVNILAAAGIRELDEAESVRIRVGGLPQQPQPPLNYQIVYSLEGVLDYYTTPSWVLRDGEPAQVDALTDIEPVEFAPPVGTLEAFHTAGGLSVLPWTYRGKLRSMEYKTLRYPGHAERMKTIRDLGLLELEPVAVGALEVVPRELFIAVAEPRLRRPDAGDLVALRVEVEGTVGGARRRIVYDLVDFRDEATGLTAMERTTGFSLSITGLLQARGLMPAGGVATPDACVPADLYVAELDRRGVRIGRAVH
jgi:lysine 6-dehydrogenase